MKDHVIIISEGRCAIVRNGRPIPRRGLNAYLRWSRRASKS